MKALELGSASRQHVAEAARGFVEVALHQEKSLVVRACATSPLKLLNPRTHGPAARIFSSTYGGGLVGGDRIELDVVASEGTKTVLSTQASTKVYRTDGPGCRQELRVRAGAGSLVVSLPDPIVCYAGAKYEQQQRFNLAKNASLVMLDWFTSGRHGCGERWAFDRYTSLTEISIDDRRIFRDSLLLDPEDGPLDGAMRMGLCDCFAALVIAGVSLTDRAVELLKYIGTQASHARDDGVIFAASPIPSGVIVRVSGRQTQAVAVWLRERLGFVADLVGEDPWARKW